MQWNLYAKCVVLVCQDSKDSLDLACANDLKFILQVDDVTKIMCNKSSYTKALDSKIHGKDVAQLHLLDDIYICI